MQPAMAKRSLLEQFLGTVTEVEPGEGPTALLLTLNVFLLLTAYYVIKPVREALILVMPSGAEYKSYLGGAIAVALLFAVPAYASAVKRFPRSKLVVGVTLFFASHLLLFYGLSHWESAKAYLGLFFFVWVGIFNMMVVAQFWAFAADIYTVEKGKRLFALLGVGASVGSAVGGLISKLLIGPLGTYNLLLIATLILGSCALLTYVVDRREISRAPAEAPQVPEEPSKDGAFQLVFKHRYLTLIAAFSLLFTIVNSNGEYILGSLVRGAADAAVAAGTLAADKKGDFIGGFYGDFFFVVNTGSMLLQTFVVSRLVKYGGMKWTFFTFPVIALLDAAAIAVLPILAVTRWGKTAERRGRLFHQQHRAKHAVATHHPADEVCRQASGRHLLRADGRRELGALGLRRVRPGLGRAQLCAHQPRRGVRVVGARGRDRPRVSAALESALIWEDLRGPLSPHYVRPRHHRRADRRADDGHRERGERGDRCDHDRDRHGGSPLPPGRSARGPSGHPPATASALVGRSGQPRPG
jgi:AAA family ATP:ADP antiporter